MKRFILIAITLGIVVPAYSYAPTNFTRPYEVDFKLHEWNKDNFRIGAFGEYGTTKKCRDWDENKKNVLQIYNPQQSSVAMLLGAPAGSVIEKMAKDLGASANTVTANGCRGQFTLTGEYEEADATIFAKYKLPINLDGVFELACFVPFKHFKFKNVTWTDHTKDILSADKKFKSTISSQLAAQAKALGNLDINENGFDASGLGDIVVMLGWYKDFKQNRAYLKNVRVNAKVGLSIPTGEKKDEDQALSLPLGNDGAWGIPASLGLDLDFIKHFRAGLELSFLGLFDCTRTHRMKTSTYQTDFLLLHKGVATKSQGASWQFNLFAQNTRIWKHFSGMIGYQFLKHDENRLSPKSYDFSYPIVNSAESLKEWHTHSLLFQVGYEPYKTARFKPHVSLFYKMPITGKRAILAHTIGARIAVAF